MTTGEEAGAMYLWTNALEQTSAWMIAHTDDIGGHHWVCNAGGSDPDIVWCSYCGTHQIEAPDWLDNPPCVAISAIRALPGFPDESFAALITREKNAAIEQERERCAKVAERDCTNSKSSTLYVASARIAAAIRATSPQDGKER